MQIRYKSYICFFSKEFGYAALESQRFFAKQILKLIAMKKIILLTIFNLSLTVSNAQIMFEKAYGANNAQRGISVFQTINEDYVIAGNSDSSDTGSADIFLTKITVSGDTIWTRKYGSTGNDFLSSMKPTANGGYIIAGYTNSIAGNGNDIMLLNIDKNGDLIWSKTFGGIGEDKGADVVQNSNEDFIITGTTGSYGAGGLDAYVLSADSTGNLLWFKSYGGSNDDAGNSIHLNSDGGYLIAGETKSFGSNTDAYLIRVDNIGNKLWSKAIGGSNIDYAKSGIQTSDGGFIFTGTSESWGTNNVYVVKTDSAGEIYWTKIIGGGDSDFGNCIIENNDSSFTITGQTSSFGPDADVYLIKLSSSGSTDWTRVFGGVGLETGNCISQTADNGFVITGSATIAGNGLDAYLIKTNASGKTSCTNTSIPVVVVEGIPVSASVIPTDSITVISLTSFSLTLVQGHLPSFIDIKCYSNEVIEPATILMPDVIAINDLIENDVNGGNTWEKSTEQTQNELNNESLFSLSVYPNPNNGSGVNVSIRTNETKEVLVVVYDELGRESYSKVIFTGGDSSESSFVIDPSGKLKPGIYMVTATSEKKSFTKRLIVR